MNKTEATVKAYLYRGCQLWQRAVREYGIDTDEMQPTLYLCWLENLLPTLKPSSRRQYLAGAKELLLTLHARSTPDYDSKEDLEKAILQVHQMQSSHYSTTGSITKCWRGQTSSQKAKKCSLADLAKLAKETDGIRGKWIKPALLWMLANNLVGLRPSEWRHAHLDESEGKTILVVLNGKNTNGRSHGEMRHLDLSGLGSIELKWIRTQIMAASQYAKDDSLWNIYYAGVRQTIHRITRRILPYQRKYPTLYSSRHQFAANAKSAGMSKVEIAALMGHAVDTTAASHYGKKKHGKGGCRVRADVQEVQKVRVRSAYDSPKNPRMK